MMQTSNAIIEDEIDVRDDRGSSRNDEFVSDEINDIISHNPSWVVRHGVTVMGMLVLLLLGCSWFVRYPDIVRAPMTIVALHAPKKVIAKSEGKLQSLLVTDGERVKENQPLAYLQSTGNHDDVFAVREWIVHLEEALSHNTIEVLYSTTPPKQLLLGELQQAYYEFQAIYHEALQTLSHGFYTKKLEALRKDVGFIEAQNQILLKQKKLVLEDFEVHTKEFQAREHLAKESVIAPLEFGHDKSKIIEKSFSLQQMEAQLLGQRITRHNKQKEVMELEKQIEDWQDKFRSSLSVFKNKTEEWISRYVILSPEEGTLQFVMALQENQYINPAQHLFYIEPENSTFYGEIVAQQAGIGKVAVGQSVVVRVESYPSTEFGYLQGYVKQVSSLLGHDGSFHIYVTLLNGMKTSYKNTIPFKNNMKAKAEIITQERRLLEKFFSTIIEKTKR